MALFWRIWMVVALVNIVVLTIFVALATLQFANINSDLIDKRLFVLAERTAAPFEAAAKIGLPLSTVRNADALLERARQTDDAILAIDVFDTSGRIVHSTTLQPSAAIPAEAQAARASANGDHWHTETASDFLSGVEIVSRDGTPLGGILVVYPDGGNATRVRAMAAELGFVAIAVVLAAAVVSSLWLRFTLARQIELFESIDKTIAGFERVSWRSAAGHPPPAAESDADDLLGLLETA
ncbi:MAG: hypothetical protein GY798_32835, partial [Hyphomicrobiales bacterium]|nr:hypothetical protein [Hyphomicrobiales bacterium]